MEPKPDMEALVTQWREQAATLRRFAAIPQAEVLETCASALEAAIASANEDTLTVKEAAALSGVAEETVRRAVRRGEVTDRRANPRGAIRVKAGDLPFLRGKAREKDRERGPDYNPAIHAQRLLALA